MFTYLFRRILLMFPTLLGITLVVFSVMALSPGGTVPAALRGAIYGGEGLDSETKKALMRDMNRLYNLSDPLPIQYLRWLNNVSPFGWETVRHPDDPLKSVLASPLCCEYSDAGNPTLAFPDSGWNWMPSFKWPYLGRSSTKGRDVAGLIYERVQITIVLNLLTIPLVYFGSIIIGMHAARNRGSPFDVVSGTVLLGLWSLPVMWVGVMAIGFLANAQYFRWFPTSGLHAAQSSTLLFTPTFGEPLVLVGLIILAIIPFLMVWVFTARPNKLLRGITTGVAVVAAGYMMWLCFSYLSYWPLTVWLVTISVLLALTVWGLWKARFENALLGVTLLVSGAWCFLMGFLLSNPAFQAGWLGDAIWHLILPVFCMAYGGFAFLSKLTRTAVLENILADYSRTARAKGVSEQNILWQHVFRNSLLPLITVSATLLPGLLAGSVIVESIFSINGMGQLAVEAVAQKDREVVLAITLVSGVLTLISYLIADILYAIADPRVSYE